MAVNFWFEHVIDAYLVACAEGRDWREAVAAAAENTSAKAPCAVLTQQDLKFKKGLKYSRQHIGRLVKDARFPPPFQLPASVPNTS